MSQEAIATLTATLVTQGHPTEYAKHMAIAAVFQTDLKLRNAQLTRLLSWLKQEHSELHQQALTQLESNREAFAQRLQIGG